MPPLERRPSYIQFTPKRAMASFENLVALANYEERLKEARKIVWRDRGEPPVEVQDLWECLEHAGRGGIRAGALAFAIRSGVNFLLVLTRIKKVRKELRFALIRHALFGPDSFRFGAMLGSFVLLYKYILNCLPILIPPKSDVPSSPFDDEDEDSDIELGNIRTTDRKARLSVSAKAQQTVHKQRTRDWFPLLSGAVAGGIAIMFEKRSRRVAIGQQLFVRGLQGSYNAISTKHNFSIPHGDVILFSLACGQIMYSFLLRQDTLPYSYNAWIGQAAKVPLEVLDINKDLIRKGNFRLESIDAIISVPNIHPVNKADLLARRALATLSIPDYGPLHTPCMAIHPTIRSCLLVGPDTFLQVFKWMVPVYGALHFIPMLLFKRQRFINEPLRMILRTAWGTTRSSAFLGVFVMYFKAMFCGKSNLHEYLIRRKGVVPKFLSGLLESKRSFWVMGALTGLSLFVEEKKRRAELAMYVLPKGLESAWIVARGRGLVMRTGEFGEALLAAVGMGMVMRTYQNDPQHLSGLVRRILYQFVGPN